MSDAVFSFSAENHKDTDAIIRDGLGSHTAEAVALARQPHNIILTIDQAIKGGLLGILSGHCLYVKLLWVDSALRGRSYGQALLQKAEDEARQRGATISFVDTASYQAPEFYKKCGYTELTIIKGYYSGHDRIFLRKEL